VADKIGINPVIPAEAGIQQKQNKKTGTLEDK
jgi:hypothetical protein